MCQAQPMTESTPRHRGCRVGWWARDSNRWYGVPTRGGSTYGKWEEGMGGGGGGN